MSTTLAGGTTFETRYRRALMAYFDGESQEDSLMAGLELGRAALAEGHGLLEVLLVHHTLICSLAEQPRPGTSFQQSLTWAHEFLTQVVAPFEMAHLGWHQMADRLRLANEELEQRVAERTSAHREAVERLDRAQQIAAIGSWEFDLETGTHIWSREMQRICGLLGGPHPGGLNGLVSLIHHDDRERYNRWFAQLKAGRDPEPIEYRIRRPDGEYRVVSADGEAVAAANGKVGKISGTLQDITERKVTEAKLYELQSELAHISRLSTVGHMTSALAHEITQPLAAIAASASAGLLFLARPTPDIDQVHGALRHIHAAAKRASDVITSIRSIFTKETHEKTSVDINRLVLEVLRLVQGELRNRGIALESTLLEGLPHVRASRVQLQQVILNLIMNAIEAMDSIEDRARVLRVTSELPDPNKVLIAVRDTGSGIDPRNLDRIFDAFFTTKSSGMGMGLSICQTIVEAHGGRLWASAGIDLGSVLNIQLPAFRPEAE
jgi:PAS domain S-box-containing protein